MSARKNLLREPLKVAPVSFAQIWVLTIPACLLQPGLTREFTCFMEHQCLPTHHHGVAQLAISNVREWAETTWAVFSEPFPQSPC